MEKSKQFALFLREENTKIKIKPNLFKTLV